MPHPTTTSTRAHGAPGVARPAGRLTATAAALLALLVFLAGCSQDPGEGEQPALGGEVTEPEQGIQDAGEAQLAPGAGVAAQPGEPIEPEEQTVGDPSFVQGEFGEVPIPTGAEAFDDATVEQDVTTQTFHVRSTSPTQLIEFYRGEMTELGWTAGQVDSSGETQSGDPAQLQATFIKDGQTLLIAVAELDGQAYSQLSLSLSGV